MNNQELIETTSQDVSVEENGEEKTHNGDVKDCSSQNGDDIECFKTGRKHFPQCYVQDCPNQNGDDSEGFKTGKKHFPQCYVQDCPSQNGEDSEGFKTGRKHFPQCNESHVFDYIFAETQTQRGAWLLTVPKRLKQKKHFKQHNISQLPI